LCGSDIHWLLVHLMHEFRELFLFSFVKELTSTLGVLLQVTLVLLTCTLHSLRYCLWQRSEILLAEHNVHVAGLS
jgi:hypothetical protein